MQMEKNHFTISVEVHKKAGEKMCITSVCSAYHKCVPSNTFAKSRMKDHKTCETVLHIHSKIKVSAFVLFCCVFKSHGKKPPSNSACVTVHVYSVFTTNSTTLRYKKKLWVQQRAYTSYKMPQRVKDNKFKLDS